MFLPLSTISVAPEEDLERPGKEDEIHFDIVYCFVWGGGEKSGLMRGGLSKIYKIYKFIQNKQNAININIQR